MIAYYSSEGVQIWSMEEMIHLSSQMGTERMMGHPENKKGELRHRLKKSSESIPQDVHKINLNKTIIKNFIFSHSS